MDVTFWWWKFLRLRFATISRLGLNVFCDIIDEAMLRVIWNHVFRFFFHWATFVVHFSGSLMEANRSNKQFTKYDYLIRCSHALSGLSHNARQTTSGRKVYFFTSKFWNFSHHYSRVITWVNNQQLDARLTLSVKLYSNETVVSPDNIANQWPLWTNILPKFARL